MTEEQKRRAMLAFFYQNQPSADLCSTATIPGVCAAEHTRIFDYLKDTGCVTGNAHWFLEGRHQIIGAITSKGIEVHETNGPFITPAMSSQTFNISHSTNVAAGNQNTIDQSVQQSIQALVSQIENAQAPAEQKAQAMGLLRQFVAHPLVASLAGSALGALLA